MNRTPVILTIDTELSLMAQKFGVDGHTNMLSAVYGRTALGDFGIGYQIGRLNSYGIKAVFFVEALHTLVLGQKYLRRIVDTILSGGHEVQLHLHPEWLWWADPPNPRVLRALSNFDLQDQTRLIELGADIIERCGAPRPVAIRAGGFEANDSTVLAAAKAGMKFDSSYNESQIGSLCQISRREQPNATFAINGIIELPVTCFEDYPGHLRHAQLCAISSREFKHLLRPDREGGRPLINILSHSFELLNRARTSPNPLLVRRFEALCAHLQREAECKTIGKLEATALLKPVASIRDGRLALGNIARAAARMVEQAIGEVLYDRHRYARQR